MWTFTNRNCELLDSRSEGNGTAEANSQSSKSERPLCSAVHTTGTPLVRRTMANPWSLSDQNARATFLYWLGLDHKAPV
jgi:hypothetical protein